MSILPTLCVCEKPYWKKSQREKGVSLTDSLAIDGAD